MNAKHALVPLGLFVLAFGGGCQRSPEERIYHLAIGPWVGFGPLFLAQERGYFQDAGVSVDLTVLTGLAERNSALQSGRIDGLAAPVDFFVRSTGVGLPMQIVLAIDESTGGDGIVAKPAVAKMEDLRGKKLAYQRGLPSDLFLRVMLLEHGMRIEEVDASDMENAQAAVAFVAGHIDAAVLWEPWLTKAREDGGGHLLASTREHPDLIVDCLAFSPEVTRSSPQAVRRIVHAVLRAIEDWKRDPEAANRIMAPYFHVTPEKLAALLKGVRFADLARNRAYFGVSSDGPIFEVTRRASQIWREAGAITATVAPDTLINKTFVTHASP